MQLVQLSDIHVGSFFKQQVFDTVVEEVNKLNPDAIIIILMVKNYTDQHSKICSFPQDNYDRLGYSPMVYSYCHALPTHHI